VNTSPDITRRPRLLFCFVFWLCCFCCTGRAQGLRLGSAGSLARRIRHKKGASRGGHSSTATPRWLPDHDRGPLGRAKLRAPLLLTFNVHTSDGFTAGASQLDGHMLRDVQACLLTSWAPPPTRHPGRPCYVPEDHARIGGRRRWTPDFRGGRGRQRARRLRTHRYRNFGRPTARVNRHCKGPGSRSTPTRADAARFSRLPGEGLSWHAGGGPGRRCVSTTAPTTVLPRRRPNREVRPRFEAACPTEIGREVAPRKRRGSGRCRDLRNDGKRDRRGRGAAGVLPSGYVRTTTERPRVARHGQAQKAFGRQMAGGVGPAGERRAGSYGEQGGRRIERVPWPRAFKASSLCGEESSGTSTNVERTHGDGVFVHGKTEPGRGPECAGVGLCGRRADAGGAFFPYEPVDYEN